MGTGSGIELVSVRIGGSAGDINRDGSVDSVDLGILVDQWLGAPSSPSADIAPDGGDGIVNFLDYAVLAGHWLEGVGP
jgi:hypothetical protein